jgi:GT2 family glycosyltransferase
MVFNRQKFIKKQKMNKDIDVSVIIVSFNTKKLTQETIESVVKNTKGINYELLVIDNDSKDGSVETLRKLTKKLPLILIENHDNVGFGYANNQGMKKAKGKYILLLNSDTKVESNVLGDMVNWMDKNPSVGISSCALKNADRSFQGTGGYFPNLFRVFAWMFFLEDIPFLSKIIKPYHPMHANSPFYKGEDLFKKEDNRDWVTGAYFLIRKEAFKDVGYFDKDYFMYVEEVDYCFRAKQKGWQVKYLPKWDIIHYGGASGTSEFAILSEYKGIKIFYSKHYPSWQLPILIFILKLGAFLRIILYGLMKGLNAAKVYAKAFSTI